MHITSAWAGRYAKTYHGITDSLPLALWWFISWSILEVGRICKLNKYHYGNMFGFGSRITDKYGRKLDV